MIQEIGVAVIGAGMAGRAHAQAYATAPALYAPSLPPIRRIAIADVNTEAAQLAARRFGYSRAETSWEAIAEDPSIHAVSVVVANHLHRPIVEGLLAAGKHVLCEKPLADTEADARAMATAAERSGRVARLGFTYRRTPAINAIKGLIDSGSLGRVLHFSGRYWTDYAADPAVALSWRFTGAPGSGALADIGSHITDIAEFLAGPALSVQGGRLSTVIATRPFPRGNASGHGNKDVSTERGDVGNEDHASFSLQLESAPATIEVSRVAYGHPNTLTFEVFCENGSASFDQRRTAEFLLADSTTAGPDNGFRHVLLGPEHPYISGGLAMDTPGVGFGVNDSFAFQARAFLDEVAGFSEDESLPRCASFHEGLHNMQVLAGVVESANAGGKTVVLS